MALLGSPWMLRLIHVALFFSLCFAEDPYANFQLELSYITASPLGVPQQVLLSLSLSQNEFLKNLMKYLKFVLSVSIFAPIWAFIPVLDLHTLRRYFFFLLKFTFGFGDAAVPQVQQPLPSHEMGLRGDSFLFADARLSYLNLLRFINFLGP